MPGSTSDIALLLLQSASFGHYLPYFKKASTKKKMGAMIIKLQLDV